MVTVGAQALPIYESPSRQDFSQAEAAFKRIQLLERTAAVINSNVRLPSRMPLVLRECGSANAMYQPADRSVILCYELLETIFTGIERDFGPAPMDQKADAAYGAIFFIIYHEIGHGLSHLLRLPILGREEDAVDSIASYLILRAKTPVQSVEGTLWFFVRGVREPSLSDYAGVHSLGPQRAFTLLCQALGKDREQFAALAAKVRLPKERAERCEAEYSQLKYSVRTLLGRHIIE
jgi:hypothetical protein